MRRLLHRPKSRGFTQHLSNHSTNDSFHLHSYKPGFLLKLFCVSVPWAALKPCHCRWITGQQNILVQHLTILIFVSNINSSVVKFSIRCLLWKLSLWLFSIIIEHTLTMKMLLLGCDFHTGPTVVLWSTWIDLKAMVSALLLPPSGVVTAAIQPTNVGCFHLMANCCYPCLDRRPVRGDVSCLSLQLEQITMSSGKVDTFNLTSNRRRKCFSTTLRCQQSLMCWCQAELSCGGAVSVTFPCYFDCTYNRGYGWGNKWSTTHVNETSLFNIACFIPSDIKMKTTAG